MVAPHKTWTVLPHGELETLDDGLVTVTGKIPMPMGQLDRRMTLVRLADGRLVVFSAIALEEDQMERVEALGRPAFLIAPDAMHRLDIGIWKDRYPDACVIAPAGARDKVAEVAPVDEVDGFDDPAVTLIEVAGTDRNELALRVDRPDGVTLILNDVVGNIRDAHGLSGAFLKLMKFAGDEPQIPKPIRSKMVEDKAALAAQFREWAAIPGLVQVLVSHGEIIADRPADALNALADSLD